MIRKAWRGAVRFLRSAVLATWLLGFVAVWTTLGTLIPQSKDSADKVAAWAKAYPALEAVLGLLGLHHAFTATLFMACVALLGVSTALCAWERTKVALKRAQSMRAAATKDAKSHAEDHDFEVTCEPSLSESEAVSIASATFERLGVKTKRRGELLSSVSSPWSVWGSPVFHWALVTLIVFLFVGNMLRSDGLIGLAVGQTKPDVPTSYGLLNSGALHFWGPAERSFRLDGFDPHYLFGGIDRGPTPAVTVLDSAGSVVMSQRVYPNAPIEVGSLTIHPSEYGLSAAVTLVNPSGAETASSVQLVDFSASAPGGTVPVGYLTLSDSAGQPDLKIYVTVPLDEVAGVFYQVVPKQPRAHIVATTPDGKTVVDTVLKPGEQVALPVGGALRLRDVGYYARLSVVDDRSIPLLYAGLVVAMVGLTVTAVARQQIVLASPVGGSDAVTLAVTARVWRNGSTSRSEIENELTKALGPAEKGNTT